MGDPLSVAASIIGIIAAAGKVAETLGPLISNVKDTKNTARTIQNQVKDSRSILQALQRLFDDLEQSPRRRRELIQIDQLRATLLDGTVIFSDLEPVVLQLSTANESLRSRVQWARKRDQLETFVSRLELFKSSITVMLNILQCESDLDAMTKRQELYDLTSQLLQSNRDLSRRLSLLESRPRDDSNSTFSQKSPRTSLMSIRSQIRAFEFERDLKESWVYRKARRSTADVSFRSSTALSHAWSALSDISLSDISAISVVALPISSNDLSNGHYYRQDPGTLAGSGLVLAEKNAIGGSPRVSPAEKTFEERFYVPSVSESERPASLSPRALTADKPLLGDGSQISPTERALKGPPSTPSSSEPAIRDLGWDRYFPDPPGIQLPPASLSPHALNADKPLPMLPTPSSNLSHSSPFTEQNFTADCFSLESEDSDNPMPTPSESPEAPQQETDAALKSKGDMSRGNEEDGPKPATLTKLSSTEVSSNTSLVIAPTVSEAEEAQHLKQKKKKKESLQTEEEAHVWIPQATPDGRLTYFNTMTASVHEASLSSFTHPDQTSPIDTSPVEALTEEEKLAFWIPQATSEGRLYFYNTLTNVYGAWLPDDSNEPSPWIPQVTEDATQFYYNTTTKSRATELPLDMDSGERERLTESALSLMDAILPPRIATAAEKEVSSAESLPSPPPGDQEGAISKASNPDVRRDDIALDWTSQQGRTGGGSRFLREYKLAVIGGERVGKSGIVIQLTESHEYVPTIEDSYRKQCVIDGEVALLDVLATAGQEEYSAMREQYMRTGEGFMIVYSITNRVSFEETLYFYQQLLRVKDEDYFPMILVGNHCEREGERQVSVEEGQILAREFGCPFMEVSAKNRINIDEAFDDLVREVRRYDLSRYWPKVEDTPETKLVKRRRPRDWLKRTRRNSLMEAIEEVQEITTPTTQRSPRTSTPVSRESQHSRGSSSKGRSIQTISSPIIAENSLGWI